MLRQNLLRTAIFFLVVTSIYSCKTIAIQREIRNTGEISTLSGDNQYIKAHMHDGTVFILSDYRLDNQTNLISGLGRHLDINRSVIGNANAEPKWHDVDINQVALVETNDPGPSIVGALAVVTGVTAVMAIYCQINPKACFGSCPTFYAHNGDSLVLMAEGFSSSVLPSREKNDIDMLYHAVPQKHSSGGLEEIAKTQIDSARLIMYNTKALEYSVWTTLGSLSTLSNGFYLTFTLPLWLLTGIPVSTGELRQQNYIDYPTASWAEMGKFARFPQGMPAGINLSSLRSRPPQ